MTSATLLSLALTLLIAAQQPHVPQALKDQAIKVAQMAIEQASTATSSAAPQALVTKTATEPVQSEVSPAAKRDPAPVDVSGSVEVVRHPGREFGKGNDVELVVTGDFEYSKANVWGPDNVLRVGTGWVRGDEYGSMVYGIGVHRIPGEYKWEVQIKEARTADHDGPTKVLTGVYVSE